MKRRRLPGWLGNLLAPAEDPRRDARSTSLPDPEAVLAELRRARSELAQLRLEIEARDPYSATATDLADEEQELLEAEQSVLVSLDERRARAALMHAADVRLGADL